MRRGDLAGPELERRDGQVLGAGQHAAQHAEVAAVQHVARPHHPQPRVGRRVRRPVPEPGVVGVARCLEVGLGARVGARRARRRRRREQLQHAQRLRPEGERVVPGVAAEEHALAGPDALDLAGLGVRDDHRALEHVQHLVGGEDRAEVRRVAEAAPGRHPEQQHVDLVGRGVDPVEHLARLRVAPDVAGDLGAADQRGPVERRPRRRGRQRRPLDERHSALRGSCTRSFAATAPSRSEVRLGEARADLARPAVGARRLRGEHDLERVVGVLGPRHRLGPGLDALDQMAQAVGPGPRRIGLRVDLPDAGVVAVELVPLGRPVVAEQLQHAVRPVELDRRRAVAAAS